ncbi:MAG: TonB-dependent receptor [Candidatus Accumulibacter sp.]|nr:TonB-dependent receptor [Accumulibacter sp.]
MTASRIEQSTLEAPASMTVISADKIEASGAKSVGEALSARVPGFLSYHDYGVHSHSPQFSLRGMGDGRTKVMLDGISLVDGYNGGTANMIGITMSDIERIEVAPGATSALYGSDAIGGVVNIISKVPDKREMRGRYLKGFNDLARDEYEVSYRDAWENGLAASVSVRYLDFDGYNDTYVTASPGSGSGTPVTGARPTTTNLGAPAYIIGDKGRTPATALYFNGKLYYKLDAKSKFFAGLRYVKTERDYSHFNSYLRDASGSVVNPGSGTTYVTTPSGERLSLTKTGFWNTVAPSQREEKHYHAGYDGKVGDDFDLKATINYTDIKYWSTSAGSVTATTFDGGPGTQTSSPNQTLEGVAQLGRKLGEKHYFLAGVSMSKAKMDSRIWSVSDWRHPQNTHLSINDQMKGESMLKAVFFQDQYFVTDALTLYAGARYDKWETSGLNNRYAAAPFGTFVSPQRKENAISPKLSGVYRVSDTLTLRSSVGSAFRAPTNYDLYANIRTMSYLLMMSDPNLKPEKATSWDVGVEKALPGNGVVKAAAYVSRIKDMLYRKRTPYDGAYGVYYTGASTPMYSTMANAARAKVQGIELSGEIPVASWLRASAGYSYTDAKITDDESGAGLEGKRVPYIPKHLFNVGLDAKWREWRGFLSAVYVGERYATDANNDVKKYVPGALSDRYWLANLRVSYQIDRNFQAAFIVHNLFDKEYYTSNELAPGRSAAIQLQASF